jgi:phospholipid/cholesterol/gamma-HCH transport system substrate-binding protein
VRLAIDKRFNKIPDDSSAAVFTSGLLGDQYVSIQPGGSPENFKDGDQFVLMQNSMQLEELIGKYLVGQGDTGKPGDKGAAKADAQPDAKAEGKTESKPQPKPNAGK